MMMMMITVLKTHFRVDGRKSYVQYLTVNIVVYIRLGSIIRRRDLVEGIFAASKIKREENHNHIFEGGAM